MTAAPTSFRDPEGRVVRWQGRILRAVTAGGEQSLQRVLASPAARAFVERGSIVPTRVLDAAEARALLASAELALTVEPMTSPVMAEHEAAPFANYPHEWAPEMLHAAGALTLELALSLLPEEMGLKDATPSNVMFWGLRPVFIDVLSVERRDPHDATWVPDAQFVRTFLLPLLVNRRFGVSPGQHFLSRRDGLDPDDVYPLLGWLERVRPRSFGLVTFPVWAKGRAAAASAGLYQPRRLKNPEQARFILTSLLRRRRASLDSLQPNAGRISRWSGYMSGNNNYAAGQFETKRDVVRRALSEISPADVLDVGCNTGVFSLLAAELGARVVAIDSDPVVIGGLWRAAAREKRSAVLPLVVDITRPSPALGWSNTECRSFLDRATGAFDAVLMLALIHHLLVTDRIPLPEIFRLARQLTRRWLLIEYIDPSDSMFTRIVRGREALHRDFNRAAFEQAAQRHFRIVRSEEIDGAQRRIYLMDART